LTTTATVRYNALMNGYLVFALVTTLQLVGAGVSHYTIDVIRDGSLQSQYAVTTDGTLSRFVRSGDQPGSYMDVERAAAFGQVYTVLPGAAMNADAKAAAQKPTITGTAAIGAPSVPPAAEQLVAAPAVFLPLPPIAFSLGDVINGIGALASSQHLELTVSDPVQGIVGALASAAVGSTPMAPVSSTTSSVPTAPAGQTTPDGTAAGTAPSAPKMLTLSFSRRGEVTYLELPQQKLLLAVHVSP